MKSYLQGIVYLIVIFFSFTVHADSPISKATTQEKQANITPARALEILKEGNKRFMNNKMRGYNFAKEMKVTSTKGQFPLAIIHNCIDSRSIPEILFDQGMGNIFVSRIAGNVVDKDVLGGMEFATKLVGTKLIVIMGHNHCGAVQGACSTSAKTGMENLDATLTKILPAVDELKKQDKNLNCGKYKEVDKIARQNVLNQLNTTYSSSKVIKNMVDTQQIYLLGAMHDIRSGEVIYFDKDGKAY